MEMLKTHCIDQILHLTPLTTSSSSSSKLTIPLKGIPQATKTHKNRLNLLYCKFIDIFGVLLIFMCVRIDLSDG